MPVESVGLAQVFTVVIFLGLLLIALVVVKRHKTPISERLHGHKRVQIMSETSLNTNDKLQILRIDARDYVLISSKGQSSQLFALPIVSQSELARSTAELVSC